MRVPRTQALGSVGLTLLGIWIVYQAAETAVFIAGAYLDSLRGSGQMHVYLGSYVFPAVVYLVLGGCLIFLRRPLAGALFARDADFEIDEADATRLQAFLVALLGVWLFATAVVDAAQYEAANLVSRSMSDAVQRASLPELSGRRVAVLFRLAIGVALILGSDGLVRAWNRLRHAGRSES